MTEHYSNPFDESNQMFRVLINAQQQYSLWPLFADIPHGWALAYGPESHASCIAFIEQAWQDMRPASVRQQFAGE